MKKRVKLLYLLCILCLLSKTALAAVPDPTDIFFVNDFAGVLSAETEEELFTRGRAYYESDKTQVVVTTVDSLEGADIESYALEMARTWGIGDKDADNGILILLAVSDREIRIEVGTGLEGVITDTKSGRFIRRAADSLSAGDFDAGIRSIYLDVLGELEEPSADGVGTDSEWASLLLALFFASGIFLFFFWFGRKHGGGSGGHGGYHGGGFFGGGRYYGGFGGGGFGGFGGRGGGGFSGGGGGFSGGGASGKF